MKFAYTVKTVDGKESHGFIEAQDKDQAGKSLHDQGKFVLELHETSEAGGGKMSFEIPFLNKISLKDKIIFTNQLAMMTHAGLPLLDAFEALHEQTDNKKFAQVIQEIADEVKGGTSLSQSLEKRPKIFPQLYTSSVKSGEKSGKLDEVLNRLAEQLQKDYDLITKVKGAMTYPVVVIGALIAIVILMLIFVIPQLKIIFADMGATLPLPTQIVLALSDILRKFWYLFFVGLIGLYFAFYFGSRTPAGKLLIDRLLLKTPIVSSIFKKVYIARFTRTMGSLVASGLPMLDVIDTVKGVINNKVYQNAFEKISDDIESGIPLSLALKKQNIFPAMIYHLIAIGEKSGKLDYVLSSMADFFDKEVEATTASIATMVEPILIILIGAGVGFVVASVIMPIYSLVNVI